MPICKHTAEGFTLDPSYQASGMNYGEYSNTQDFEIREYESKYFWERNDKNKLKAKELDRLPRPGMVNGRPCFYGGMTPMKETEEYQPERIVNQSFKYEWVDFCKIRSATDQEFKRFFEPFYKDHRVKVIGLQFYLDNKPI